MTITFFHKHPYPHSSIYFMDQTTFIPEIGSLLETCGLPVQDLSGNESVVIFSQRINGDLAGVVGIEVFGENGLLRSLAVAEEQRGNGLGYSLVAHAETWATETSIQSLWLLTESAAEFFKAIGYVRKERSEAPETIQKSAQFRDLCPVSAVLMKKNLCR